MGDDNVHELVDLPDWRSYEPRREIERPSVLTRDDCAAHTSRPRKEFSIDPDYSVGEVDDSVGIARRSDRPERSFRVLGCEQSFDVAEDRLSLVEVSREHERGVILLNCEAAGADVPQLVVAVLEHQRLSAVQEGGGE